MNAHDTHEQRDLGLRIGVAVRRQREFDGLTQADLAAKAGVSQAAISMVERGKRSNLSTLDRVSLALDKRLSEIVKAAEETGNAAAVISEARAFVAEQRTRIEKSKRRSRSSPRQARKQEAQSA